MSMFGFRGGPWNGFVIEYGERVSPDAQVRPGARGPRDDGLYLLYRGASAYVWSAGIALAGPE